MSHQGNPSGTPPCWKSFDSSESPQPQEGQLKFSNYFLLFIFPNSPLSSNLGSRTKIVTSTSSWRASGAHWKRKRNPGDGCPTWESCAMSVPATRTGNFCLASNRENQSEKKKVVKNNHHSQPQLLPQDTTPEKKIKKKDSSTAAVAQTSRAWWDSRNHVVLPSKRAVSSSSARFTLQTPSSGFHPHHAPLECSAPSSGASRKNKAILGTHSCMVEPLAATGGKQLSFYQLSPFMKINHWKAV